MRILPPPLDISDNEGFSQRDRLRRTPFGDGLARLVELVADPTVIAVDGPWGSGKSTFLRMWAGSMRSKGYPVIYFDAFANDYIDDAFAAIAGEIVSLIDQMNRRSQPQAKKFLKKARGVGGLIAKSAIRIVVPTVTQGALSGEGLANAADIISDEATKLAESYADQIIGKHSEHRELIHDFRVALRELPKALSETRESITARPLIFIIDELDRCKPSFALELLERVKHFFQVENVHFILGTHTGQLANSVTAAYGQGIDANKYLQKFIQIVVTIPDIKRGGRNNTSSLYIDHIIEYMDFDGKDLEFINRASRFVKASAIALNLTLRDIERIMTQMALYIGFESSETRGPPALVAGLYIIKTLNTALYRQMSDGYRDFQAVDATLRLTYAFNRQQVNYAAEDRDVWQYCMGTNSDEINRKWSMNLSHYSVDSPGDLIPFLIQESLDRLQIDA